jgi:hypothetical protein
LCQLLTPAGQPHPRRRGRPRKSDRHQGAAI